MENKHIQDLVCITLCITSEFFYRSHKVQSPTSRNPYVLQMKGNGIKKGQTVAINQLCANKDVTSAAKLFTKWFARPVRAKERKTFI